MCNANRCSVLQEQNNNEDSKDFKTENTRNEIEMRKKKRNALRPQKETKSKEEEELHHENNISLEALH